MAGRPPPLYAPGMQLLTSHRDPQDLLILLPFIVGGIVVALLFKYFG